MEKLKLDNYKSATFCALSCLPGDMTITEAVVAELSLPHNLKSFIKGLLSKDLALSQNVVPITSWTNAELHV